MIIGIDRETCKQLLKSKKCKDDRFEHFVLYVKENEAFICVSKPTHIIKLPATLVERSEKDPEEVLIPREVIDTISKNFIGAITIEDEKISCYGEKTSFSFPIPKKPYPSVKKCLKNNDYPVTSKLRLDVGYLKEIADVLGTSHIEIHITEEDNPIYVSQDGKEIGGNEYAILARRKVQ